MPYKVEQWARNAGGWENWLEIGRAEHRDDAITLALHFDAKPGNPRRRIRVVSDRVPNAAIFQIGGSDT